MDVGLGVADGAGEEVGMEVAPGAVVAVGVSMRAGVAVGGGVVVAASNEGVVCVGRTVRTTVGDKARAAVRAVAVCAGLVGLTILTVFGSVEPANP